MDWQDYKSYHKNKYGSSSQNVLSQDYQAYKTKQMGNYRSPARLSSPSRSTVDFDRALATLPPSRVYKTNELKRLSQNRYESRGSPTRGWASISPQRGTERHELKQRCGDAAYLDPEHEKYPIMPALRYNNSCNVSCQGVQSAYNRSCQYKHFDIAKKAQHTGERQCHWSPSRSTCSGSQRSPQRVRSPSRIMY